jgi:hypothetical protein
VVRYQKRISGLLLDWFDFNVEILPEVTNLAVIGYKSLYRTVESHHRVPVASPKVS